VANPTMPPPMMMTFLEFTEYFKCNRDV
jgi:hypothetical protein